MTTAKPEVSQGKKFTAIWIIPLVALVLGASVVIHTLMTEGPEIEIAFETASGLTAGKTQIKFRNVEIGMVQEVILSDDMEGVIARVKLNREATAMLGEDTSFWVVTARIGGGGISGLDTLLSGAYIEISPADSSSKKRKFVGLDRPPITPTGAPGLRLILLSEQAASVSSGDPVLYNGYKVGRVENTIFDAATRKIRYTIFIDAPFHELVDSSVRFWDVSGIAVSTGVEGIQVNMGSVESLLLGGVTFGTPPGFGAGEPVEHDTEFRLFATYEELLESPFRHRDYYVVLFDQSLKGLYVGAPVEYRGIKIGQVHKILVKSIFEASVGKLYDDSIEKHGRGSAIPVLIYLEPGRVSMPDTYESAEKMREIVTKGVAGGLRISLVTGNLLSGAKFVNVDYYDDVEAAVLGEFDEYPTIPTTVSGIGQLEHKISNLLDNINALPIDTTVKTVNRAVLELNHTLVSLRNIFEDNSVRTIPTEVKETIVALRKILEDDRIQSIGVEVENILVALNSILNHDSVRAVPDELQRTLSAARFQLEGESTEVYQLVSTLQEVEAMARSLREFLDLLEAKPESLIRGKTNTKE